MEENEYQDLVYFGYDYDEGSHDDQVEFMKELPETFPSVEFKDAYNEIKGYRQEVYLPTSQKDNYHAWLMAYGWFEFSMTLQLMMMSGEHKDEVNKLIELAKQRHPERFKKEA